MSNEDLESHAFLKDPVPAENIQAFQTKADRAQRSLQQISREDAQLTCHSETDESTPYGHCVDLTFVKSSILFTSILNPQTPLFFWVRPLNLTRGSDYGVWSTWIKDG